MDGQGVPDLAREMAARVGDVDNQVFFVLTKHFDIRLLWKNDARKR